MTWLLYLSIFCMLGGIIGRISIPSDLLVHFGTLVDIDGMSELCVLHVMARVELMH